MSALFQVESQMQDAWVLYKDGQYFESALAFEKSVEVAIRHELYDQVSMALYLLAIAWHAQGEFKKGLNALLRIRDARTANLPAELELRIQGKSFELMYDQNPDLSDLEER